jgi:type IX secretion system PorP/SprF family membrane protein
MLCALVSAQNLTMDYYSYLYNLYNINPAYCANGDKLSAILNVRQRAGLNTNNSMAGLKGILGENQGIGARVISDTRSAFQVVMADVTYGYKLKITTNQSFIFGLSAGLTSKSFNSSKIRNSEGLDQTDPVLQNSNMNSTSFMSGAGFLYNLKKTELSVSLPHLLENGKNMLDNVNVVVSNPFELKHKISLTPIIYYFAIPIVNDISGIQLKVGYNNKYWLQTGYQNSSNINVGVGFNIGAFGVGYNYTVSNQIMRSQTSGTHEFFLKLNIVNQKDKLDINLMDEPLAPENKLGSIVEKLNELSVNENTSVQDIKYELGKIKYELKRLSDSNFSSEDPETIDSNLTIIDEKINEIETRLNAKK